MRHSESLSRLRYGLVLCGMIFGLILATVALTRCSVKEKIPQSPSVHTFRLEIPRVDEPKFLLVCEEGRYTLLYDTLYRQAAWVAHVLTRQDTENDNAERKNNFVVCPAVRAYGWPYATAADYTRSSYDRGHLVPSADRVQTQAENNATFRMSNIAPQTPRLNRVLWNNLEREVRRMAGRLDTLWIVTGSELKPGLSRIGTNRVGVPELFFKVLLAKKDNDFRAIGFVIPNVDEIAGGFWDYAVTVDSVERMSGIDFFPNLPDALENRIEAEYDVEWWL